MKRILILETSLFKGLGGGGSYIQADYYAKLLRKKGYQTELFLGDLRESQFQRSIRVIRKIRKSDLVIGFGTPLLDFYLQWLCLFLGKKGIFCIDTIIVPVGIIKDHIKREKFPYKVIFHFIKKILYDNFIVKIVIPPRFNLINLASCKYVSDKLANNPFKPIIDQYVYPRVYMKERDNNKSLNSKIVLFYGALYRGRGVIDLVKACHLLWRKGINFNLLILGYPVDLYTRNRIREVIDLGPKDRIILKEEVDNIGEYVKVANMVVLPFRYPCAFQPPLTILEPMGLGIPVITTDVGSHGEWIKDGKTGLICKKENPQDVADKIVTIFKDNKLVNKITTGAYNLLQKRQEEKDVLLNMLKKLETSRVTIVAILINLVFLGDSLYGLLDYTNIFI